MKYLHVIVVSTFAMGCNPFADLDKTNDGHSMSFQEYRHTFGREAVELPSEASNISMRSTNTRDGFDVWLRCTLTDNSAELIWSQQLSKWCRKAQDEDRIRTRWISSDTSAVGDLRFKQFPWEQSTFPDWWLSSLKNAQVRITRVCVIKQESSAARTTAFLWVYSKTTGELWIWNWSRQHLNLEIENWPDCGQAETD